MAFSAPNPATATTTATTGAVIDSALVSRQVQQYYLPVYAYLQSMYDAHAGRCASLAATNTANATHTANTAGAGAGGSSASSSASSSARLPPLLVGISAPQGCGKTTLTDFLIRLFQRW